MLIVSHKGAPAGCGLGAAHPLLLSAPLGLLGPMDPKSHTCTASSWEVLTSQGGRTQPGWGESP